MIKAMGAEGAFRTCIILGELVKVVMGRVTGIKIFFLLGFVLDSLARFSLHLLSPHPRAERTHNKPYTPHELHGDSIVRFWFSDLGDLLQQDHKVNAA